MSSTSSMIRLGKLPSSGRLVAAFIGCLLAHPMNCSWVSAEGELVAAPLPSAVTAKQTVEFAQMHEEAGDDLETESNTGSKGVAYLLAFLSSFLNGSFPVWKRIERGPVEMDPVMFNFWVCIGAFLSSLPVAAIAGQDYVFTLYGALGGAAFVFAVLFSFVAIPLAGFATAQTIWCCSAIIVAFCWGAFGPSAVSNPLKSVPISIVAVILLVVGAVVIVACDLITRKLGCRRARDAANEVLLSDEVENNGSFLSGPAGAGGAPQKGMGIGRKGLGILSAIAVGLFGGSILVPMHFASVGGLATVLSFGIGAAVAAFVVTLVYFALIERSVPAMPHWSSVVAGILGGITWNLGNICSIIAQSPPYSLSYGVAYPIFQCAFFFGGLWGIFVFREIRGWAILIFWLGAFGLAAGVSLLGVYGPVPV